MLIVYYPGSYLQIRAPYADRRNTYKATKMVTVQDIGLQLTKPVKELAEWDYPFSETLETYCSLFNTTQNTSFGEAGLVLQNSAAVYVHRIDCLWNNTEYFRNIFSSYEQEEVTKNTVKKKDKKTDISFQDFKTINFAEEVERNIDIKKNHTTQETVKCKNRRFTQLEKGTTQHIPIDIYDVNGEIIGKKYDFRCNQNISMDGILIDEFAPQDFFCVSNNSVQEKSSSISSYHSRVTECASLECSSNTLIETSHDDSDENTNSGIESERYDDSSVEVSDIVTSFDSKQNLSLSRDTDNGTAIDVLCDTSSNNCHNLTPINTANDTCMITPSTMSSPMYKSSVNSTVSVNHNDLDLKYLNNNLRKSVDEDHHLSNSQLKLINLQGKRILSSNDSVSPGNTNDSSNLKLYNNRIQNTPLVGNLGYKSRLRLRFTSTLRKRNTVTVTFKKKGRVAKNLLNEFRKKNIVRTLDKSLSQTDRPNMFHENLSTCLKYIREYDPLQYDDVTNVALDFLGFRLHVTESDANAKDNVTTPTDDEMFELQSSSSVSPNHASFCDAWFRSDSPCFLPENVDKWHELMQLKLHETERRPTFCIRDYASRIMESLKMSNQRKINFDDVIRRESSCEVARYFLASLDLASRQNVDINMDKILENNIEIILHEDDRQYLSSS